MYEYMSLVLKWGCHDIQHNNTQDKDTQNNSTQHNDIWHNNKGNVTLSKTTLRIMAHETECYTECRKHTLYAECHYAECHKAECRYAECSGAKLRATKETFLINAIFSVMLAPLGNLNMSYMYGINTVSYAMLRRTHPSRNFFVLSLFGV
jgi:hypothetical protein